MDFNYFSSLQVDLQAPRLNGAVMVINRGAVLMMKKPAVLSAAVC